MAWPAPEAHPPLAEDEGEVQSCSSPQVFAVDLRCPEVDNASMNLKIILEPSEEGGFTAYVPALPGCISEGKTKDEAMRNIREAIELYLEPVEDEIAPPDSIIEKIAV